MNCKICGQNTENFATAKIRQRYQVKYFNCRNCEFIQTEEPFWLKEAYAEPINRSDVGYVSRNVFLAKITKAVIVLFFRTNGTFIDYGGGYGMLVRLMRDAGFDFRRFDKFCPNLFAPDFEAESPGQKQYELLTAFEVFEHLPNPLDEIKQMLSYSNSLLFSTELQPHAKPPVSEWGYYAPEHGQHVSFYSVKTLREIARQLNLNLHTDARFLHLLTPRKISPFLFKCVTRRKIAVMIHYLVRRTSLVGRDVDQVLRSLDNR